jgi:hypothetical protein
MTWWTWTLLAVWGPGTLLALVVAGALGVRLVADRPRPAPAALTGGDATTPQPRSSVESTEGAVPVAGAVGDRT